MRLRKLLGFASIALALLITGCSGDDSFQKQAYALGQGYALAQKGAITYMEIGSPSAETALKIKKANDLAAPQVKSVLECAKSLLTPAPAAPEAATALGLSDKEALEAQCEGELAQALAALEMLRNAVKGG